jgi:outer membrane protein OmpA-like peptidoglycan-associated protein
MWNQPGNFSRFVQAWVFPEVFTILDYESNREGEWVERNNTLTFFAADVNDLTFTVRYRLVDLDGDGIADKHDRCPDTPAGMAVDAAGCDPDTDGDGVVDSKDRCPETVAGAAVDIQGCELDDDADGVVNRLDRCAATPAGAAVGGAGCEPDTDGDGVIDRLDNCPDSVADAVVDRVGCELDCDEDGVLNSADQCARTPAGASVNAQGCELDGDADGDGVLDSADLCPDTPAAAAVDATGCEIAKPITLRGVNFLFNSDQLTPESVEILNGVATTLLAHPDLMLEVAGHTDTAGNDAFNLDLSQRRSEAVRAYLVERGINPEHLQARGYGEQQPVAGNATAAGRAANRRVELLRIGE